MTTIKTNKDWGDVHMSKRTMPTDNDKLNIIKYIKNIDAKYKKDEFDSLLSNVSDLNFNNSLCTFACCCYERLDHLKHLMHRGVNLYRDALDVAVMQGNIDIVQYICNAVFVVKQILHYRKLLRNPIHEKLYKYVKQDLVIYESYGYNNNLSKIYINVKTLHIAVKYNNIKIIMLLIDYTDMVNTKLRKIVSINSNKYDSNTIRILRNILE